MQNPLKKRPAAEPKPAPFTREDIELQRKRIVDSYNKGDITLPRLRSKLAELKALDADLSSPSAVVRRPPPA
jgi:hypothetical protein